MGDPIAFRLFGELLKRLPVIGQAVAEAIQKVTQTEAGRYGFAVFVFDPETKNLGFTTNVERSALHAMLAEHLRNQAN